MHGATVWERVKAGGLSLVHPKTIGKALHTEYRGVYTLTVKMHGFINATDRKELLSANPTKHEEVTARRRLFAWFFLLVWLAGVGVACLYGWPGIALYAWFHVSTFFYFGYTEPVITPVQTKRMMSEGKILKIFNDITIPLAKQKDDPPASCTIEVPPMRTARNTGYEVTVRVHSDGDPAKVTTDVLAHKLSKGTETVFPFPVKGNKSLIRLLVLDEDPWAKPPTMHPLVLEPRAVNLWQYKCNLGTLPDGNPWEVFLVEEGDGGGWLTGGAPRYGKSIFLTGLIIPIILDPMSNIHIIDGKAVDFAPVERVAETFIADPKMEDVELLRLSIEHFKWLKAEIVRRQSVLLKGGYTKLSDRACRELDLTMEWTLIDELAVITEDLMEHEDKAVKAMVKEFKGLLGHVVRKGPAFGVFCILATQRPSDKSIPSTVRDMIVRRTSFYIGSFAGSAAILSKSGPEHRADWLDPEQKGVSITLGVGKVRTHMVTVSDLEKVVSYAVSLRAQRPAMAASIEPVQGLSYPEPVQTVLRAFEAAGKDRVPTAELLEILKGMGLTSVNEKNLAESLKPFAIRPFRFYTESGKQVRGYRKEDFLSVSRVPTRTVSKTGRDTDEGGSGDGLIAANEG